MRTIFVLLSLLVFWPRPSAEISNGRIALGDWDELRRTQIFAMNPDGSGRTQLTYGLEEHWMPAWSPDGRKLASVSRAPSGMRIHVMNADGTNARQLTETGICMAPSWSPDGKKIAYAHLIPGTGGGLAIWIMNADGTNPIQLVDGSAWDNNVPTWSPDGTTIAFTSNRRGGRYQIWIMNADGTNPRALTTAYYDPVLTADIEQKVPAWSPDGRFIAYWSGVEASDPRPNLPRDVWVMNSDGSGQRRLTAGDDPAWSPDSSTIIHPARTADGKIAVGVISPEGTGARILFVTNGDFGRASWQGKATSRRRLISH